MSQAIEKSGLALAEVVDIIVVGAGPVGQRFVELAATLCPQKRIRWFGNEPWQPYDRIKLTPLLSGAIDYEEVFSSEPVESQQVEKYFNCGINEIDREARCVVDTLGVKHYFRYLVLATGSSPHMPSIPGIEGKRVYSFRNLKDVSSLKARTASTRHTVVIGAGLLGLEAARAMLNYSTRVTVVQQAERIMNRQLDNEAAGILQQVLEKQGVQFTLGIGVREIVLQAGDREKADVKGVRLRNAEMIECDTVIVCAGIKPNVELAVAAKLPIAAGIRVNSKLQTSDPAIFAIGECAQYENEIAGLVGPGLEQASVVAHGLAGQEAAYKGYISATKLKVVGENVFSVGVVQEELHDNRVKAYQWASGSRYRKLYFRKNVLIGAIAIGEWDESYQLIEYVRHRRVVAFFRPWLFQLTGNLFDENDTQDISTWPEQAIVCNCKSITRGQISSVCSGVMSTQEIAQKTGASSVCGSCKPLLDKFTGSKTALSEKVSLLPMAFFGTLTMALIMVVLVLPPFAYSESFRKTFQIDSLWLDSFYKQISGFSIVALIGLTTFLSLSKRWNGFRFGRFVQWRNLHLIAGFICIVLLVAHTGMNRGVNLNGWLMFDFLLLSALGGFAAFTSSQASIFPAATAIKIRRSVNWLHLLAFWPFPVLLSFHILSSYYF